MTADRQGVARPDLAAARLYTAEAGTWARTPASVSTALAAAGRVDWLLWPSATLLRTRPGRQPSGADHCGVVTADCRYMIA